MSNNAPRCFLIGSWRVEPLAGSIKGTHGKVHHLEPKVMEVLGCLAEHANNVVTREQLLDVAWGGSTNADELLTRAISELRRAFDDDPGSPTYIETVPKRGYRLIQSVQPIAHGDTADTAEGARTNTYFNGRRVGPVALALLAVVLIYVTSDQFGTNSTQQGPIAAGQSIAVLPFVNLSEDPGNEYFSDGITEEIINLLARVSELKVIGRTSSFSFKGKNEDLRSIGQQLGVRTILEGSVRKEGDRVRIVAQLIDVSDGAHIWSEVFDYDLDDVFAVQDDIAVAIVVAMRIHVTALPQRGHSIDNWQVYSAFLRARAAVSRLEWPLAEALLKEVLQLDPKFAEAHELLALCYWHMGTWWIDQETAQRLAYEAASTAISLEPDLLFAQTIHKSGNAGTSSAARTFAALDWAFGQNPNNTQVLNRYVWNLIYAGYLEEALSVAQRYVQLDPLSLDANLDLYAAQYASGRTTEAMRTLQLIEQMGLGPNNWLWSIAGIELAEGRDAAAIAYFESILHEYGQTDSSWVSELVTAARDPVFGKANLDKGIPEIASSLAGSNSFNWQLGLTEWYLFFGFIDQYVESLLASNPRDDAWTEIEEQVWHGHVLRRSGFTAHPDYLGLATDLGIVEVWEDRGPPDFCYKNSDSWICG